ncbi:MAG: hypothetical protein JWP21_283, partial [Tardiphaga sp.]|nr:hypothetical protein [Tardiphaga sp.]
MPIQPDMHDAAPSNLATSRTIDRRGLL